MRNFFSNPYSTRIVARFIVVQSYFNLTKFDKDFIHIYYCCFYQSMVFKKKEKSGWCIIRKSEIFHLAVPV